MRILVLGGTKEAFSLVESLGHRPDLDVTLSLAGRTASPRAAPVATRTGGFGGADGLAAWLATSRTDLLVDATHPFAAVISGNAARAAAMAGLPLLALRRPPWTARQGDDWQEVDTVAAAGTALARYPGTLQVFLTIGRQELGALLAVAPSRHTYLARAIEPIAAEVPPGRTVTEILGRGPFAPEAERALMLDRCVDILVTKNAGGPETAAKIEAARSLGLPVVVVRPPAKPALDASVATVAEAVAWILVHLAASAAPATDRRV